MVGGGFKSIIYTFKAAFKIGPVKFWRAVRSKNACKTCALGMGGQAGGMVNETGHFPEICKKSVQAQLTDIQGAIGPDFFKQNSLSALAQKTGRELEALGRLNHPLHKKAGDTHYRVIDWQEAFAIATRRFQSTTADKSFFYSSGRSSMEAAFLLQLFARLYGTNNVNNCSYYCHQASGVGLGGMLGTGTATVELADLEQTDLIFVIGANPASNHPRFMRELMACRRRGGKVIVINPLKEPGLVRFSIPSDIRSLLFGGTKIASEYLQPKIGGDIALLKGIAKCVIDAGASNLEFIEAATENFAGFKADIERTDWTTITETCGIPRQEIEKIAQLYLESKNTVFTWAMGITHHIYGVHNVEAITNLALLRGMIARPGAGLLPLRGHSNVQGIGSVGVTPQLKAAIFQNIEDKMDLKLPTTPGLDTMACIEAAANGEMDVALLLGGNLYGSNPDSHFAEAALNKVGFKLFMNTTLNLGHVYGVEGECMVLPVAARDEEPQRTSQESMFNFVRISDGAIVRLNNVKTETEIICTFAENLIHKSRFDFTPFRKHRNLRKAIADTVPGFSHLTHVDQNGAGQAAEFHIAGRVLHEGRFPTPSGRASFRTVDTTVKTIQENELLMMTIRSEGQFNSIVYEEFDTYRSQKHRLVALLNPDDMKKMAIKKGDQVLLQNDTGKIELEAIPFDISPGAVATYYPETNVLVPRQVDDRSRTPAFKSAKISLSKVKH